MAGFIGGLKRIGGAVRTLRSGSSTPKPMEPVGRAMSSPLSKVYTEKESRRIEAREDVKQGAREIGSAVRSGLSNLGDRIERGAQARAKQSQKQERVRSSSGIEPFGTASFMRPTMDGVFPNQRSSTPGQSIKQRYRTKYIKKGKSYIKVRRKIGSTPTRQSQSTQASSPMAFGNSSILFGHLDKPSGKEKKQFGFVKF